MLSPPRRLSPHAQRKRWWGYGGFPFNLNELSFSFLWCAVEKWFPTSIDAAKLSLAAVVPLSHSSPHFRHTNTWDDVGVIRIMTTISRPIALPLYRCRKCFRSEWDTSLAIRFSTFSSAHYHALSFDYLLCGISHCRYASKPSSASYTGVSQSPLPHSFLASHVAAVDELLAISLYRHYYYAWRDHTYTLSLLFRPEMPNNAFGP